MKIGVFIVVLILVSNILYAESAASKEYIRIGNYPHLSGGWDEMSREWKLWVKNFLKNNDIDKSVVSVKTKVLDFYSHESGRVRLIEVGVEDGHFYIIAKDGTKYAAILDGSGPTVYGFNRSIDFKLESGMYVEDYLEFFTSSIGSPDVFTIVSDDSDFVSDRLKSKLGVIKTSLSGNASSGWKYKSSVIHGNNMVDANFIIDINGIVSMTDDVNSRKIDRWLASNYYIYDGGLRKFKLNFFLDGGEFERAVADYKNILDKHMKLLIKQSCLELYRDKKYVEARDACQEASSYSDPLVLRVLGNLNYFGHIGIVNYQKAISWYRKSALQGDAISQYQLGHIYYFGKKNVPIKRREAIDWWLKSANQDHSSAQYMLALHYAGEPGGLKTAMEWINKISRNKQADTVDRADAQELLNKICNSFPKTNGC